MKTVNRTNGLNHWAVPLRVSSTGKVSRPRKSKDQRENPWVQGAAETLPRRTRKAYSDMERDLRTKRAALRRPGRDDEQNPWQGTRPFGFASLDGRPLPTDGLVWDEN